jgi:hypothetical protein
MDFFLAALRAASFLHIRPKYPKIFGPAGQFRYIFALYDNEGIMPSISSVCGWLWAVSANAADGCFLDGLMTAIQVGHGLNFRKW